MESKNQHKKLAKKASKVQRTLTEKKHILFSNEPTNMLLIGNGGLANDVSQEHIEGILSQFLHDQLLELIMPPKETFSLVLVDNVDTAKMVQGKLHGLQLSTPELPLRPLVTLYCFYVLGDLDVRVLGGEVPTDEMPPGLTLVKDFLTPEEECQLEASIAWEDNSADLRLRRVRHFGFEFLYGSNLVDPNCPLERGIPPACVALIDRMLAEGWITERPDQLTVNVYEPGGGIPPHTDTHSCFGPELLSVSLCSPAVMQFSTPDGERRLSVELSRGSLMVMRGEARYLWRHGIPSRRWDLVWRGSSWTRQQRGRRVSLTFRRVRKERGCECAWMDVCDAGRAGEDNSSTASRLAKPDSIVMETSQSTNPVTDPAELETRFVHRVYDSIADHFSSTRHSPWPRVSEFLLALADGALGADVGCGNGKYMGVNPRLSPILGSDRSVGLCGICRERGHDVIQADVLSLPYRSGACDFVLCIAVLHHLSTDERRLAGLREMARILRPGGTALVYVWALEQAAKGKPSTYMKQGRKGNCCHIEKGSEDGAVGDASVTITTGMSNLSATTDSDDKMKTCGDLCSHGDNHVNGCQLPIHVNRTPFRASDMLVPWHKSSKTDNAEVLHRYYHLFSEGELKALCERTECFRVLQEYYDEGNWCVRLEKL